MNQGVNRQPAATRASVSLDTPRSRSPSVDSEADVVPSERRFAVEWGRAIARHWASGSQGRAPRPSLVLQPEDHVALEVQAQRERMRRDEACSIFESQACSASEPMSEASDTLGAADTEDSQPSHAGQAATSGEAAMTSADAYGASQPPQSSPPTSTLSAEGGGAARSVSGVGNEGGLCGDEAADDPDGASSDSDSPVFGVPFA